jgi:hypothetical protein
VPALRASLLRLVTAAFVLVVAASSGAARAPHSLRAWTDAACEIARAPGATTSPRRAAARPCRASPPRTPARSPRARLAAAPAAYLLGTRAWPTAPAGRDVLTRKRVQLI